MRRVIFRAVREPDGSLADEYGHEVLVDGEQVIDYVDDLDVANEALAPLWKALGLELVFEGEE
ncbi:MAG: hypothetical protein ACYSUM_10470 [Planctomycetota bacterium]|jgi:hypothetical protein